MFCCYLEIVIVIYFVVWVYYITMLYWFYYILYICDFDNSIELCWCTQPPVLHQHISYICNFCNRIGYVGAPKPYLHHILVKFASLHNCNLTKFTLDKKTLIHLWLKYAIFFFDYFGYKHKVIESMALAAFNFLWIILPWDRAIAVI